MIAPDDMTLDELREALAPLLPAEAAFDGWSDTALAAAATALGVPADRAKLALPDGPVQLIDTFPIFKDAYTNPSAYGITNVIQTACDPDKVNAVAGPAAGGSSLFCNATPGAPYNTLRTGANVNTWQFADSVHPTTGGHKLISDAFTAQIRSFGWI